MLGTQNPVLGRSGKAAPDELVSDLFDFDDYMYSEPTPELELWVDCWLKDKPNDAWKRGIDVNQRARELLEAIDTQGDDQ